MTATDTVIVAYNDTDGSKAARDWAIEYAKVRGAEILLVYVISSVWQWELAAAQVNTDPIRDEFGRLLTGAWSQPLRDRGAAYRTELLIGRPTEAIMECAQRERAALVVVGMSTHGTLADLLFGGAAHKLAQHAHRPVVAVPAGWRHTADTP